MEHSTMTTLDSVRRTVAAPAPVRLRTTPTALQQAAAEAVGTFALIFVGVLVLVAPGPKDLTTVAFAHGLTIAVMVSATMKISGGQLNPAVTAALLAVRKIDPRQAGFNVAAQIVGATLGGFAAQGALGTSNIGGGVPALSAGVGTPRGILIEAVLTAFLVFVVFGTAVDDRFGAKLGGLAIGLTVALDIMAGGPLTGAAMNPARWLGPALVNGDLSQAVVYFAGPVLGAVVAAFAYLAITAGSKADA
jgi:MIP family channel proteins